jgi:hypothetical protein
MPEPQLVPDSHSLSDRLCSDGRRFTIRWTYEGYKVSTPSFNEAEVVVAAEYDAAQAEVARLRSAIEEYCLWEPGRRGHAAAHRRLREALSGGPGCLATILDRRSRVAALLEDVEPTRVVTAMVLIWHDAEEDVDRLRGALERVAAVAREALNGGETNA